MKQETFKVRFSRGVSRGRDTYGYAIVSLWIDGVRVATTNGGGYDMHGTVLGIWLTKAFQERLRKLPAQYGSLDSNKGFYGLVHYDKETNQRLPKLTPAQQKDTKRFRSVVDGMCGESSVSRIATEIGVSYIVVRK